MTEKEAMLFAYQQSAEPMIKNKVLRDALDKDLGPRNTYAQGQLVSNTVDGSRPGYSGNPLKKYKMTSSGRRLGVTVQSSERVSSKIKKYIYKDDVTGELITVFKVKITDQPSNKGGTMKAGESGNYKTLLSGPDKTEFTTLDEAESARTEYYKENPGKRIKDLNKDKISKDNRRSDIKKNEGVESYKTGDGDVVKGHSSNIKGKNKIQPDNLIYTNKDINALMANTKGEVDKVNPTPYDSLDFKQREAETEIERIKKSKLPPAEKKRLLAIQDNKLVEYVGMSDGYKTAVLSDGTTYGTSFRSLQSMDPFNEFPGMSEKEVKEFVGEYFTQDRMKNDKLEYGTLKPKYAKLSKKEMQALPQSVKDNIVKAYTFNENVKLAKINAELTNFDKVSKVQKKGIVKKLKDAGFKCSLANGVNCNDPRSYAKSIKETMAKASQGNKSAVSNIKKMGKLMNGFKGAAKWTGWGLLGEIGFAAPLAGLDYAKGANTDEIISNATYGLLGKNEDEQLREKYSDYGQAQDLLDTYNKSVSQGEALQDQTGYGPIVNQQDLKNTENKLEKQSKEFTEVLPPSRGFKGDFDLNNFYRRQEIDNQRIVQQAEEKKQRELDRGILTKSTGLEAIEFAKGGLANLMKRYYD